MANPPFNQDITNPADNAIVSQFPANERAFRDNVNSYLNVEHDISTGYHKFQVLTTTTKNALASPPTGMLVFDSTLGVAQLNTGTSGAPVWTTLGPSTGDIKLWPTTAAPAGWLLCNGQAVSRTTYAALFALIGTTYGAGDGSTTFNVPNFSRRVPVGAGGSATGVLGNTVGSTGGEETHTLTSNEMPVHNHGVNDPGHDHGYTVFNPNGPGSYRQDGSTGQSFGSAVSPNFTGISTQNAGGGAAHNNMQPSLVINFIIKT